MSRRNWTLGKFLNDDDYDETDIKYLSRSYFDDVCNFSDIPGTFNRQLWLFQTGQISEYSAIYEKPITNINENFSSSNKYVKWEIHEKISDPQNSKGLTERLISRGEYGKREHLSVFKLINNKEYLYLRLQPNNEEHKSLKLGLYESYEKWKNLIQDFKDGKSISELEKYCEINKEKIWEIGRLPKDTILCVGALEDRSNVTIDEHLTNFKLKDDQIYLYIRTKLTTESSDNYKSLKMGIFESREKWKKLIQDFENGKPISELEKYCEYE